MPPLPLTAAPKRLFCADRPRPRDTPPGRPALPAFSPTGSLPKAALHVTAPPRPTHNRVPPAGLKEGTHSEGEQNKCLKNPLWVSFQSCSQLFLGAKCRPHARCRCSHSCPRAELTVRSVAAAAGDPRRVTRGDIKQGQQPQSLQTAARGLSLKCKSEHRAILLTACCGSPLPLCSTTSKLLPPAPKGLLRTGLFHSRSRPHPCCAPTANPVPAD